MKESPLFGIILNLLCPGFGHFFWKEYIFGVFIFLIMLIGSVLFFISLLVTLPQAAKIMLLGLPILFFLFTFFDLVKVIRTKQGQVQRSTTAAVVFLVIGVFYQLLVPSAPANFLIHNSPEIYRMDNNHLAPLYKKGDILTANPLAYSANIFFFDYPVYYDLPDRFEIVRFVDSEGRRHTGAVIGLPGEIVELTDGAVAVDGLPKYGRLPGGLSLARDWPLTSVDNRSILVATFNLGSIDSLHHVPITALVGKAGRLF